MQFSKSKLVLSRHLKSPVAPPSCVTNRGYSLQYELSLGEPAVRICKLDHVCMCIGLNSKAALSGLVVLPLSISILRWLKISLTLACITHNDGILLSKFTQHPDAKCFINIAEEQFCLKRFASGIATQ